MMTVFIIIGAIAVVVGLALLVTAIRQHASSARATPRC